MQLYKDKELWTYFFEKPKNYYNKYMFEMLENTDYIIFDPEEIKNYKSNWKNLVYNNNNKLAFEIGSGSGNFATEMALKHKNINFLCDELRLKRLVYSAKKARKNKLNNIKYIRYDANKLNEFIGEKELSMVYINFPDPWEGDEHKRILSEKLLNNLYNLFEDNAKIYFKTDHLDYYLSVLEMVKNHKNYDIVYHTNDLHNSTKIQDNVKTEFENLFINKIKTSIKYIEIIKL